MPFVFNPVCLQFMKDLKAQGYSFLRGYVVLFVFMLLLLILLQIQRLPIVRKNSKPSTFESLQKIASILVISAPVVVGPAFVDFDELGDSLGKNAWTSTGFSAYSKIRTRCRHFLEGQLPLREWYTILGFNDSLMSSKVQFLISSFSGLSLVGILYFLLKACLSDIGLSLRASRGQAIFRMIKSQILA